MGQFGDGVTRLWRTIEDNGMLKNLGRGWDATDMWVWAGLGEKIGYRRRREKW